MQDLGRIVIDINEKGSAKAEGISGVGQMAGSEGGGAAAASEEIGALASAAGFASTAFTAVAGVFTVLTKVVTEVGKALLALNRFVLEVANDLRDYSPGIQLAEAQNRMAMVFTKFRMGMQYGGAIGAQMLEVGRIERTFVELRSSLAAMGAIFLRPITKYIADILEYVKSFLPAIAEGLAAFAEAVSKIVEARKTATDYIAAGMSYVWNGQQGYDISMATNEGSAGAKLLRDIARSLRNLDRKAPDQKIDYGAMNEPFLADLRLMGMKGF
jgi:hypothetical protein